jgi:hypothetical protein
MIGREFFSGGGIKPGNTPATLKAISRSWKEQ